MDVAEQIVVMNDGAVEQAGSPTDLYDHPKTEFVMSFVGTANRVGTLLVRPHDVSLLHVKAPGSEEAMIDRIVHLGFEVRVELTLADGGPLIAQLTREQVAELELEEGQIVYAAPSRAKTFDSNGQPRTEELALA
jgi:sulfate transport system ATP-binding protein